MIDQSDVQISVIVTTTGRWALLDACLTSLAGQLQQPARIIVVLDGAREIDWRTKSNRQSALPLLVIERAEQGGPCRARNDGLAATETDYVTFVDDDDLLPPGALKAASRWICESAPERRMTTVYLGAMGFFEQSSDVVDQEPEIRKVNYPPSFRTGVAYQLADPGKGRSLKVHNTMVVSKSALEMAGGWDPDIPASEHADLFIRLGSIVEYEGHDEVTYLMRQHPGSRLSKHYLGNADGLYQTYCKHRAVFQREREGASHLLSLCALRYAQAGRRWKALKVTWLSLLHKPNWLAIKRLRYIIFGLKST